MGKVQSKSPLRFEKDGNVPRFLIDKYPIDLDNLVNITVCQRADRNNYILYTMKDKTTLKGDLTKDFEEIKKRKIFVQNAYNSRNVYAKEIVLEQKGPININNISH